MDYYTVEEKVLFVKWYYGGKSLRTIRDLYAGLYKDRHIRSKDSINRIIKHFEATGSVNKICKCKKRPMVREYTHYFNVLVMVAENQNVSLREIGQALNVHHTTAYNVLKRQRPKFKSYKYHIQHEIFEEDKVTRMDFCKSIMEICNSDRKFLPRVLFTNECTFSTRGIPNHQNFRYWNTKNLHLSIPSRSQY